MNTTNSTDDKQTCFGSSMHLVYLSLICAVGITSNILLLYADYREWKKSKTPDKLLICSIGVSNIIILMFGVPLRFIFVSRYRELVECNEHVHRIRGVEVSLFVFVVLVVSGTFPVLAFDRYEALTKFPHQRTLTLKKTMLILGLVWVLCLGLAISFYISYPQQCIPVNSMSPNQRQAIRLVKIGVLLTWLIICVHRCACYFHRASKAIRNHRQKINDMFGARRATTEISFTKSVTALLLCYLFSVIPFAVSAAMFSFNQGSIKWSCAAVWASTNAYLSFVFIPVIYFAMDKRLLKNLVRIRPEETNVVHPIAITNNMELGFASLSKEP